MASKTQLSIGIRGDDNELRERLARTRVLIADRDTRTAKIVQRILFSLGLRTIHVADDEEKTFEHLRSLNYDFLITEWDMDSFDGIALVRAIRNTRDDVRIRRDIPVIMLTSFAEMDNVQRARDAGVNEFVVKPFSAAALSGRILHIMNNPRPFVDCPAYVGPCRRRRGDPPPGMEDRRLPPGMTPPQELLDSQGDYVDWARAEMANLKNAFAMLKTRPEDENLQRNLLSASHAIQAQATRFHYEIGAEVATLLVNYVEGHLPPNENHLVVIAKHIDAASVTFNQNVQQYGRSIARDLILSLGKLVEKLE